jgi:hypothetical protein
VIGGLALSWAITLSFAREEAAKEEYRRQSVASAFWMAWIFAPIALVVVVGIKASAWVDRTALARARRKDAR